MRVRRSRCARFEEAISALVDGEDPGLPRDVVDQHLQSCRECQQFARSAETTKRRFRLRVAEDVPDLSRSILARIDRSGPPDQASPSRVLAGPRLAAAIVTAQCWWPPGSFSADVFPGCFTAADRVPRVLG